MTRLFSIVNIPLFTTEVVFKPASFQYFKINSQCNKLSVLLVIGTIIMSIEG